MVSQLGCWRLPPIENVLLCSIPFHSIPFYHCADQSTVPAAGPSVPTALTYSAEAREDCKAENSSPNDHKILLLIGSFLSHWKHRQIGWMRGFPGRAWLASGAAGSLQLTVQHPLRASSWPSSGGVSSAPTCFQRGHIWKALQLQTVERAELWDEFRVVVKCRRQIREHLPTPTQCSALVCSFDGNVKCMLKAEPVLQGAAQPGPGAHPGGGRWALWNIGLCSAL